MTNALHITVLLSEAVEALQVKPGNWYVDGTFGRGGHTQAILDQGGKVIAFDMDQEAIDFGTDHFASALTSGNLILLRENFAKLGSMIRQLKAQGKVETVQGFLFDFGTSTEQLTSLERGFSFESDQLLDMRMDQRLGVRAADLLNVLPEKQLIELFQEAGGERESKAVVKALKLWLKTNSVETLTGKTVAKIVAKAKYEPRGKLHPATKVFQALRIAVNSEIESLKEGLNQVLQVAQPGNRIVTIAFHEGEDRVVKHLFVEWEQKGKGHRITKDVIVPSEEEVARNPRSRSAKMRIFEYD